MLQLGTKLLDSSKFKDSLKLVYDFQNRFGENNKVMTVHLLLTAAAARQK